MNILLVEDDASIVSALTDLLHSEGFSVQACATQDAACEALARTTFDIALLDVTLPQGNGFAVCAAAREAAPEMPVIFLTASDDEYSTVAGLDMGADDYISKPFRPDELVARVKSQLRRYMQFGGMNAAESNKEQIINGGLILDMKGKRMLVDGEPVKLTATEYKIVSLLMNNLGRVFSADEIYERVWNEEAYATENTVMVHIRRIREKIEIDAKNPRYLKVVWGIGYKIEKMD